MDVGPELFEKVLSILKELQENREVFISLVPPFDLSFEIDREVLRRRLQERGIEEENFREILSRIETLLLVTIEEEEEEYIDRYIKREELEGAEAKERREELQLQLELVQANLLTTHLEQRYHLKASSKAPSFHSIDWDIKLKIVDSHKEDVRFPYATCRIRFQREFTGSPVALLGGRPFDTIQLNYSVDEIEHLLRVFEKIRQHLEEIEREM